MATAFIALGANLNDRLATLRSAVIGLGRLGTVTATSMIYETEPVGYLDQPPFLNAVVRLQTDLAPRQLLDGLLRIETEHGRSRTFRNAPRTLDLDLLFYDDAVIDEPGLTLPHPRLHERAFVLAPLADVAGEKMHPTLRRSINEIWRELRPASSGIQPIAEHLTE